MSFCTVYMPRKKLYIMSRHNPLAEGQRPMFTWTSDIFMATWFDGREAAEEVTEWLRREAKFEAPLLINPVHEEIVVHRLLRQL